MLFLTLKLESAACRAGSQEGKTDAKQETGEKDKRMQEEELNPQTQTGRPSLKACVSSLQPQGCERAAGEACVCWRSEAATGLGAGELQGAACGEPKDLCAWLLPKPACACTDLQSFKRIRFMLNSQMPPYMFLAAPCSRGITQWKQT